MYSNHGRNHPNPSATRRELAALASMALLLASGLVPTASAAVGPYDPYFARPVTVADFGATTRPFGVAAGDYDGDGDIDLVVGRTTGNVHFLRGNGDGTFAAPVQYAWKQRSSTPGPSRLRT